jgi:hypothetical protein
MVSEFRYCSFVTLRHSSNCMFVFEPKKHLRLFKFKFVFFHEN